MFIFSVLSCALQFIGLYTVLINQTIIPHEYAVQPIDEALEHLQWAYDTHLSATVHKLHQGFKVVRGVIIDELHEMVNVEMIRSRLTAHMTEGYEVLQYVHKTSTAYTQKGIDIATTYHREKLKPAIDETMKATYKGIDMAQAYHKETVIPAIDGTIEAMKPHLHMAKEQFNKGMNFAKEYTEENVMPALGETYKAVKPHLDKYTEEVYKGIDMAMGYTEESFTSAYANIKPTMDQIINTSTEHALSLFTAGKDFTSDALRPHVERAVEATKPYLRKHIATFEAYLRDFKSAVNKTVKDTVEMHQRQYDGAIKSKVQNEVLQAMTETVHDIRTEVAAGADNSLESASLSCNMRVGNEYVVCPDTIDSFRSGGLTILDNLLTEQEMKDLEVLYDKHMTEGSAEKYHKDFCDMSKPFNTPRAEYSVINAMLPRRYSPEFQGNIYEQVAASVAKQLFPDVEMVLDYDQLLDKMPGKNDAVFAWHQDMAYWPNTEMTPDTRTVTFSLAFDSTNKQNGCIHYIPGSGSNKTLRSHKPIGKDRDEAHAIAVVVGEDEIVHHAEVKRGSASIHDEWVVHGSSGNNSNGSRRTYVIAFRTKDTVKRERAAGFTHSHNDEVNWDKFNNWDK